MNFEIVFCSPRARGTMRAVEKNPAKAGLVKQVKKALAYLQVNPTTSFFKYASIYRF